MAFEDNERLQEFVLVTGDKIAQVGKKWWLALFIVILGALPLYFFLKTTFIQIAVNSYSIPKIVHTSAEKQPLQILDKGIFNLGNNYYSAYVKIKNIEFDWGVAAQEYTAEFITLGGTSINKVNGSTFILPSREKLLVFSRFFSDKTPDHINFSLEKSNFIHKPQIDFNYELERRMVNNTPAGLVVSAGIKNLTPFTVRNVNLPVAVYNSQNEIVAVNFTTINDLLSGETRTFQYSWPLTVPSAVRAEIMPEVNVFDRNIFYVESGAPSF